MVAVGTLKKLDEKGVGKALLKEARLENGGPSCTLLQFADDKGQMLSARIYQAEKEDNPHFLYFPAEFETDETLELLAKGLNSVGFTLIAFEYRGTGQSQGEFSLEDVFKDAETFYNAVKLWMEQQGRKGDLVVMGRSFGCTVAINLAVNHQKEILCMVLESAFDSGKVFLERSGIDVSNIPEEPIFENRAMMAEFKKPVMFIHSPRDVIQSLTEVEWLVAESRSKATQFQIAPSGTRQELANQVGDLYMEVVEQWVNLRRGIRPPRKRPRP